MNDFKLRAEDMHDDEFQDYFVHTKQDIDIINLLKGSSPLIIEGSRGSGKSFLLKITEFQLNENFKKERILPVYSTFMKGTLLHSKNIQNQFMHWMLLKLGKLILRVIRTKGINIDTSRNKFLGISGTLSDIETKFEKIIKVFENSYNKQGIQLDNNDIPSINDFKDSIEDICKENQIKRMCFLFDEVAHILRPEQQRQFFTLFRDLRSPYINCNAAVYPGITSYGSSFERKHDAVFKKIERDLYSKDYLSTMTEIVIKQAGKDLKKQIETNKENFNTLCYTSSGNPRTLLTTLDRLTKMNSSETDKVIKEFYREEIWSEYSGLADKFVGHRELIDWGRNFFENSVLLLTKEKNDKRSEEKENNTTNIVWIHRDSPKYVFEALRLLEYVNLIQKVDDGVKSSKSELGSRYQVNFGCLLSLENSPTKSSKEIADNLSKKRFTEYGHSNKAFEPIAELSIANIESKLEAEILKSLKKQLKSNIDSLDIKDWQKKGLHKIKIKTIQQLLDASPDKIGEIDYVGPVKTRQLKDSAFAAIFEYLSG